jgi:exosome complex exonuclease RRP6
MLHFFRVCYPHFLTITKKKIETVFKRILDQEVNNSTKDPFESDDAPQGIPNKVDITKVVVVRTEKQLNILIDMLRTQKIFGLDLKHSRSISFLGIVSLMQISFSNNDFVIDTLLLHDSIHKMKHILEDVNVCKVIHGRANDIHWLQRDYNVYITNVFDTHLACLELNKMESSYNYH